MPGTGGQHRKTEARFIQVKDPFQPSPWGRQEEKEQLSPVPEKGYKTGF